MSDKIGDSMKHADWNLIPDYMRQGVLYYIEYGTEPGDFLKAILCNDLYRAVDRADMTNIQIINQYVIFFYNYAPSECWGSPERYAAWLKKGGLKGKSTIEKESSDV